MAQYSENYEIQIHPKVGDKAEETKSIGEFIDQDGYFLEPLFHAWIAALFEKTKRKKE